jgi:hopene-associated glycosyltransferase HpnB
MLAVVTACARAAALAWAYLLAGHGGFWRTDQRLPPLPPGAGPAAGSWPAVTAIVPARDEASALPGSLPTLLRQDYPGPLAVILVDDESSDGTAQVAADLGRAAGWAVPGGDGDATGGARMLRILAGRPLPAGWAGKVWAMAQGAAAAGDADYLLFTDADIAYAPGAVTGLVRAAVAGGRGLVSQMALLRAETGWERAIVPAFVYFFAQLYPFRRVNRPGGRTAAAAGGCMLVRREVLAAAGGLAQISGARIDDVALGRLLKRRAGAATWLGLTTSVTSTRPYDRLADLWDMVARSAYTQLRYSPALLAGTLAGLLWLYVLPPAAAVAGLVSVALGGGSAAAWLAGAGIAGWAIMAASYVPMLRLYGLSPARGLSLPLIALMYAGMTAESGRRHHAGRGGEWKGRTIQQLPAADAGGEPGGLQAAAAVPDLEAGLDVQHPPARADQAHFLHFADDRQQRQAAHVADRPDGADLDVVPVRAVVRGDPVVDVPPPVIDADDPRRHRGIVPGVQPDHQLGALGLAVDGGALASEPDVEGRVPAAGGRGPEVPAGRRRADPADPGGQPGAGRAHLPAAAVEGERVGVHLGAGAVRAGPGDREVRPQAPVGDALGAAAEVAVLDDVLLVPGARHDPVVVFLADGGDLDGRGRRAGRGGGAEGRRSEEAGGRDHRESQPGAPP